MMNVETLPKIDLMMKEIRDLKAQVEHLRAWLEIDATCPCCMGITECEPGCTFAEDAPMDAERMGVVRVVLVWKPE